MARTFIFQNRNIRFTGLHGHRTSRVKDTTRWRVDWAGHFTGHDVVFPMFFDFRIGNRYGIQQCLGIWMLRIVVEFITIRHFHNLAQIHYCDLVAQVANDTQIMSNEQISQVEFLPQVFKQINDLGLNRNIESRYRFVTDDEVGFEGKRLAIPTRCLCPPLISCG